MQERNKPELIRKYFAFLFDQYNFKIIDIRYFDTYSNWAAVLISDKFRVRFHEDRGTVMIAFGPLWDPPGWEAGPWHDLDFVIAYLNRVPVTVEYSDTFQVEPQLERLAKKLVPYLDQICDLFSPENFLTHEAGLDNVGAEDDDTFRLRTIPET